MSSIVFVSDFFSNEVIGGAELTSDAIISGSDLDIRKVKSLDINDNFVKNNLDSKWIFGNFTQVDRNVLINIIKSDIRYDIIEYDFKFCKLRSPKKHIFFQGTCDCSKETHGKLISIFFHKSRKIWFMSEKQKTIYMTHFPFLQNSKVEVLSSVFTEQTLSKLSSINVQKNDKYLIINSNSWIKSTKKCIQYALNNNLSYELVSGLSHNKLINKLASSRGLIFLPSGGDTCPRIVIEAKLLNCDLRLNDNVLHKDEEWFSGDNKNTLLYLKNNNKRFWESFNEK